MSWNEANSNSETFYQLDSLEDKSTKIEKERIEIHPKKGKGMMKLQLRDDSELFSTPVITLLRYIFCSNLVLQNIAGIHMPFKTRQ